MWVIYALKSRQRFATSLDSKKNGAGELQLERLCDQQLIKEQMVERFY